MEAPKCRVCGEKHWASESHKLPEVVERRSHHIAAREVLAETVDRQAALIRRLEERIRELEAASEGRKAYMRQYMKRRRSSGKERASEV